ncbi:MAG: hypothetical protein H6712_21025 [Myxococcales bacterium]|nr:hypothetical protein [Myxococcales bacterium]MCB9716358.1 hypothetical protein [Myxococcales bacterium]
MSRYVRVTASALGDLEEVARGLAELGLPVQRGRGHGPRARVMLEGSVECPGEPVDLRLPAGTLDAVEDFGFVLDEGAVRLVCGELDRTLLEASLLPPLERAVGELRVRRAAASAGLEVEAIESSRAADGRRRLVLRRR